MILSLRSFSEWVQQQAAAVQSSASNILDFTTGSVIRAIVEANAAVALWFQWLLVKVLAMTRAATSAGADLDSWMADFSLGRLPAIPATGVVTFGRLSTVTAGSFIPLGTVVRTADGTASFQVVADASNPAYSPSAEGWNFYAVNTTIDVPVEAVEAGTGGNVAATTISMMTTAMAGVDTVTNALAFTNGEDAETDDAFRARFADYINTRHLATVAAVGYAISAVQQGLIYSIAENVNYAGAAQPGHFVVTVDDGSGSPSAGLLTNVTTAIEAVRPIGSTFEVHAPSVVTANIAFTFTAASGYVHGDMDEPIEEAVADYINSLPMATALRYTKLFDVIYSATDGVANVTGLTVNGGTADVGGGTAQVVRAGTVVAS